MYQSFFGFTEKPFHTTPDPRFLFPSPSHQEALATLFYGVDQRQGFLTITGEVGVGKTTILRTFLEQLESTPNHSIFIYNPNLSFHSLLKNILEELGQPPSARDTATLIQQLQDIVIEKFRQGGTIVLLIDEAQNMPLATLENLRMLSNIETTTDKLIQIVLIGQPELELLLQKKSLRQLKQRITLHATIHPLTQKESFDYIEHRLAKAGTRSSTVFTKQALSRLIQEAEGIPRRLNILCDNALLTGYAYQQKPITDKTVKEVIADANGTGPPVRSRWLPAAIAAGLIILAIPFVQGNTQFLSLSALEENDLNIHPEHTLHEKQPLEAPSPATRTNPRLPSPSPGKGTSSSLSSSRGISPTSPSGMATPTRSPKKKPLKDLEGIATNTQGSNNDPSSVTHIDPKTQQKLRPMANQAIYAKSMTTPFTEEFTTTYHTKVPSKKDSLRVHRIQRGDTLSQLIRSTYGKSSPQHIQWVLEHNPHILNARVLFPGQTIAFPPLNTK